MTKPAATDAKRRPGVQTRKIEAANKLAAFQ
jgi:hypothetical protein